ncbi:tripartite tricarboxylate transporter substrate binding protein [Aromatoleum toluolicum]|uniref:Tripartite tricarboxylate transporter substrate binding protein n=1 Tax=Aromatoleum toluolicum TaxID=90060 RepID=A0ABX1NHQ1_9RHOO|nr:tripartite tricarboxylate transporter substrate binding protein [Aromatoleum toluolicum]NMF98838.1 tripartite tricarboxylate transporter substrate binding protein [Aromatoleum toluolicum]
MALRARRLAMLGLGSALLLGLIVPRAAQAEDVWPSRQITMITPSSAGSGPDALARAMAQRLSEALKQPVIVDNRPGASGVIAINAVSKAKNDGYTLLYTSASAAVVWPAVGKSVPYDVMRDLTPVAQTAAGGVLLLVNSEVPAKNLQELIELVKANPGKFSYGTWATGSSGHLMMEWLKGRTGMKMTHVPYRTTTQMLTELSSGVLKIGWADPSAPVPFLRTGKIRGIVISGNTRAPQVPDIPTLDEAGHKFNALGWFGIFAPAGTNPAVVKRLSDEVNRIQGSSDMGGLMANLNFEAPPKKSPEQFREIVQNDLTTWKKIATDSNISVEN